MTAEVEKYLAEIIGKLDFTPLNEFLNGHVRVEMTFGELVRRVSAQGLEALNKDHIEGFSLLGGEPFEPENQECVNSILKAIKQKFPQKTVWCYTGFLYDTQLMAGKVGDPQTVKEILGNIDVLVDGKFVEELKRLDLLFRGSSNQRIIDVKRSLEKNETVWLDGVWQRKMGSGDIYEGE